MVKNKKVKRIICVSILIIISVSIWTYFNRNYSNNLIKKNTISEISKSAKLKTKCFIKKTNSAERKIMLIDKDDFTVVGADIFIENNKKEDEFVFVGHREGKVLDVFSQDKNSKERIYKITNEGVIEGEIEKSNLEEVVGRTSKAYRVKDINKVKFDEKNLIQEIDCDKLEK